MIRMHLDQAGRLFQLEARPAERDEIPPAVVTFDWKKLFQAAQIDPARFSPVGPARLPSMAFDARMAWTGTYSEGRSERIRVEAAGWRGRPVFFDVSGEWVKPQESSDYRPSFLNVLGPCIFFSCWEGHRSSPGATFVWGVAIRKAPIGLRWLPS
jgi:hypothetical protein